ncbi:hypothetical protein QYE76_012155 [Lolium multiflorum]|uniref:Mitochondrial protein n=1 Tax=Lolium multiflorum TaxID=4521 RepID=A0AAD8U0H0_LOLMU|nr:hypothetical protein QYE76_012155 [Lolium multiflorum]
MENYSLLMGDTAVMKMAVESMEKPSGAIPHPGGVRRTDSCPPDLGFVMAAALKVSRTVAFPSRGFRYLRLKSHSLSNVIGDLKSKVTTWRQLAKFCEHYAFVSMVEPLKVIDALGDPDWLLAMQEELNNFKRNDVWTLMKRPDHCRNVIGTKWVFKNKEDEHGIVIRNKARLVA